MINEFRGERHRVLKINNRHAGAVDIVYDGRFRNPYEDEASSQDTQRGAKKGQPQRRPNIFMNLARRVAKPVLDRAQPVASRFVSFVYDRTSGAFLPQGFPTSVSDDYTRVACFDLMQTLCSSVTNTMATRAVLEGVGVGKKEADLFSSTFSFLFRDAVTKIYSILFGSLVSSDFDHRAKTWRFVADVCCDLALLCEVVSVASWASVIDPLRFLWPVVKTEQDVPLPFAIPTANFVFVNVWDCKENMSSVSDALYICANCVMLSIQYILLFLSLTFYPVYYVINMVFISPISTMMSVFYALTPPQVSSVFVLDKFLVCLFIASALKAIVGVAGGCSKAAITQHFAKKGNAADVSAKSGNRDYASSLVGLVFGTYVTMIVPSSKENMIPTLMVFLLFSGLHVFANYKVVKSLTFRHLNAPRLEICLNAFYTSLVNSVRAGHGSSTPESVPTPVDMRLLEPLVMLSPTMYVRRRIVYSTTPTSYDSPRNGRAHRRQPQGITPFQFVMSSLKGMSGPFAGIGSCAPSFLTTRIQFGCSLKNLFYDHGTMVAKEKNILVQKVEEELSSSPYSNCLVYDILSGIYTVIHREGYDARGIPQSQAYSVPKMANDRYNEDSDDPEVQMRRSKLSGLSYLHAYFYAYMHDRAVAHGLEPSPLNPLLVAEDFEEGSEATSKPLTYDGIRKQNVLIQKEKDLDAFNVEKKRKAPRQQEEQEEEEEIAAAEEKAPKPTKEDEVEEPPKATSSEEKPESKESNVEEEDVKEDVAASSAEKPQDAPNEKEEGDKIPRHRAHRVHPGSSQKMMSSINVIGQLDGGDINGANGQPKKRPTAHFSPLVVISKLKRNGATPIRQESAQSEGSNAAATEGDDLEIVFNDFVKNLSARGWELDRVLVHDEGWTTAVHYM